MSELLWALVVLAGTATVTVLVLRWRLHRRNRIHPRLTSAAPLRWLVSPATPARLHRRLRTTVQVSSAELPRRVVGDVALHAVELDRRLVLVARRPLRERQPALRDLAAEVDELDRLALAVRRPGTDLPVGEAKERLTALAEARAEVDALDHTLD